MFFNATFAQFPQSLSCLKPCSAGFEHCFLEDSCQQALGVEIFLRDLVNSTTPVVPCSGFTKQVDHWIQCDTTGYGP
jgi:hypothetical protein